MQNAKNLYASNNVLQEELDALKKASQEKERKFEQQDAQLRKLQLQLIQYQTSATIASSNPKSEATNHQDGNGAEKEEGKEQEEKQEGEQDSSPSNRALQEENGKLRENVRLLSSQVTFCYVYCWLLLT